MHRHTHTNEHSITGKAQPKLLLFVANYSYRTKSWVAAVILVLLAYFVLQDDDDDDDHDDDNDDDED